MDHCARCASTLRRQPSVFIESLQGGHVRWIGYSPMRRRKRGAVVGQRAMLALHCGAALEGWIALNAHMAALCREMKGGF